MSTLALIICGAIVEFIVVGSLAYALAQYQHARAGWERDQDQQANERTRQ